MWMLKLRVGATTVLALLAEVKAIAISPMQKIRPVHWSIRSKSAIWRLGKIFPGRRKRRREIWPGAEITSISTILNEILKMVEAAHSIVFRFKLGRQKESWSSRGQITWAISLWTCTERAIETTLFWNSEIPMPTSSISLMPAMPTLSRNYSTNLKKIPSFP